MSTTDPNPIDIHVGSCIRLRRKLLGISQEKLADRLGLTFQQIQKYERGTNRVSASKLFQVAVELDVPVEYFFDGIDRRTKTPVSDVTQVLAMLPDLRLVASLRPDQRQALMGLIRAMAVTEAMGVAA